LFVVGVNAVDSTERLVPEIMYYVTSGTWNST